MTLQADNTPFIVPPDRLDPLLEDEGRNATQRFYAWINDMSGRITLEGNGTPEGSLEANAGRLYIDKDGVQGERIWFKTTNGGSDGWELA